jgi:hypothetical protein
VRPVRAIAARERIVQALEANPEASLRWIAAAVDVSPETVRSVRHSLLASSCNTPEAGDDVGPTADRASVTPVRTDDGVLTGLRSLVGGFPEGRKDATVGDDPAFSSRPDSARFAVWFESTAISEDWAEQVDAVPLSRIYEVTDEARRRAARWADFARTLESRTQRQMTLR